MTTTKTVRLVMRRKARASSLAFKTRITMKDWLRMVVAMAPEEICPDEVVSLRKREHDREGRFKARTPAQAAALLAAADASVAVAPEPAVDVGPVPIVECQGCYRKVPAGYGKGPLHRMFCPQYEAGR